LVAGQLPLAIIVISGVENAALKTENKSAPKVHERSGRHGAPHPAMVQRHLEIFSH